MRSNQVRLLVVSGAGVILSACLYLGGIVWRGEMLGFPLDDAWIHQTYARNLAYDGQWSYVAGQVSMGSTAPLWTLALSLGYAFGVDLHVWAFLLGAVTLALVAWLSWRVSNRLFGESPAVGLLSAALCVFEWHLVWAAFSGMETVLFAALTLLCVDRYLAFEAQETLARGARARAWLDGLWMGLCGALLVLTRPEGLLLLGLVALSFALRRFRARVTRPAVAWAIMAVLGCALLLIPYAIFNLRTSGLILPTTFYAKQAEYRIVLESLNLPSRFARLLLVVSAGPQIVLLPGFIFCVGYSIRRRCYDVMLLWGWWLCTIVVYAVRLPVTYQHGRYLIPTIPVLVILGIWGSWQLIRYLGQGRCAWIARRVWVLVLAILLATFWVTGARAYARDVAFIQGEMGTLSAWLDEHVPAQSRLAVHDIGMIGYQQNRPFIDLAGLVTPEVIPFIDDADQLLSFMESAQVDYVVVFPDWSPAYQRMVSDPRLELVYNTNYAWTLAAGRENLAVYRTNWASSK